MNRFEASLYRAFERNSAGAPARREAVLRTQQACARLVRERRMLVRTGSAAMFRQVARFSAPRLWAAQALVLFAGVAGLYSLGDVLQGLAGGYLGGYVAFFSPVLVLGCLPEMFRSEACGMAELECATRASRMQLMLVRLVSAAVADLACLAVLLGAAWASFGRQAGVPVWSLALYALVPFLTCAAALLNVCTKSSGHGPSSCAALCVLLSLGCALMTQLAAALYMLYAIWVWLAALAVAGIWFAREAARLARRMRPAEDACAAI
ncbi:MAG: hypothetical protein ACLVKK_09175 [Ruthenibacterium sp.]